MYLKKLSQERESATLSMDVKGASAEESRSEVSRVSCASTPGKGKMQSGTSMVTQIMKARGTGPTIPRSTNNPDRWIW